MWVKSTGTSTTFSVLAVVYPVEVGGSAPTITRVDDDTVTVVHAGHGIDDTISVDPDNVTADFIINLAGEGGGGGGGSGSATTINAGTVNGAP
jgi:hypothetical protein